MAAEQTHFGRTRHFFFGLSIFLPGVVDNSEIENWQEKVRHIVVIPNYKDSCGIKLGTILWQCFVPLKQKAIQSMEADRTSRIFGVLN